MNLSSALSARIGALAGVAAVLTLFISLATYSAPHDVSDQELVAWWSDSANQNAVLMSTFFQIVGGLCFLVFLVQLRGRLVAAEGDNGVMSTLVFTAGALFVALLFAGGGPRGAVAWGLKHGESAVPGPDTLRYLPQVGYMIAGLYGGMAAAAMMGAASAAILRTRALGRWLGWFGVVAAVGAAVLAALLGPIFFPVLYIWMLATSVAMWRASGAAHAFSGSSLQAA